MSTLILTDRVMTGLDSPSLPVVARSVYSPQSHMVSPVQGDVFPSREGRSEVLSLAVISSEHREFLDKVVDQLYELQQYEPLHCVTPILLNYVSLQRFGFTESSALEILQNHYRGL